MAETGMIKTAADIGFEAGKLMDNIASVIYVNRVKLEYLIAALCAGGHVMLADTHGVGKTSLARALAGSILWPEDVRTYEGVEIDYFNRVQCTVDLLPQDILGYSRISGNANDLVFNKGPIFSHFLLCDEINLLTPKTQGSFFQAMEESVVTIEGKSYHLPTPFFLISTMNLKGAHLFPLPAPQLDRFMIRLSLGYPDENDEISLIRQHGQVSGWDGFSPVIPEADLLSWMRMVDNVFIHDDLLAYIVRYIRATRQHPRLQQGASPRAGVKISRFVRALSLVRGSEYVTPDLVKEVLIPLTAHRVETVDPEEPAEQVLREILEQTGIDIKSISPDRNE